MTTTTTGEIIKKLRKDLNLSADFVAEKLGVSRSTIFRYENGSIEKVPIDILEPLARILNTEPTTLMGWNKSYTDEKPNQAQITNNTERYENLSHRDKKDIAKTMTFMLDALDTQEALMFDGEALDDETKELLKVSLENSLKMGKVLAKQKYTPNKYKK